MTTTTFDGRTTGAKLSSGGGFRETALIIRREILTRMANRTILTATGVLALVAGAAAGVGGWFLVDSVGGAGALTVDTRAVFATAMISALLASLVYSASSLTSGVVEEKSSRIVEILLTKIGIVPLLAGKMIGIGLVTLAQLLVIGGAGVAAFSLVGGWSLVDVALGPSLLWFFLWFLLGYVIFAALNTTLASTVSRQEDLNTAVMPLSVLQMVLLVVSLYVLPTNLGSPWLEGLSFVPLFSSYLMPMRFALEDVSSWEMVVAAGIAAASVPALFWLSTVVYRNNALRTGSRVSLQKSLSSDTGTESERRSDAKQAPDTKKHLRTAAFLLLGILAAYVVTNVLL